MPLLRSFAAAAFACVASVLALQPASATMFCSPKRTADGFVALRAGPSPTARLIGRMRSSDEVLIGQGRKGKWVEMTWWRGASRYEKGYDAGHAGRGWAHSSLIGDLCG